MKSGEAEDTPNAKKANDADNETCWRLLDSLNERSMGFFAFPRQQDQMCDGTGENKNTVECQRQ